MKKCMNKNLNFQVSLLTVIGVLLIQMQLQAQISDEIRLEVEKKLTSEVTEEQVPEVQEQSQEDFLAIWRRQRENLQSRGVILSFYQWPNEEQEQLIINVLKDNGLKKTQTIERFKVWIFDWIDAPSDLQVDSEFSLKPVEEALNACSNLPPLSVLEYCESDTMTYPNNIYKGSLTWQTEAGSGCMDTDCFENSNDEEISILSNVIDESSSEQESCKLISSAHPNNSTLSNYWAQELVGSDLLREELKTVSAPEKENYIAVFDERGENSPEDDLDSHSVRVKNIISGEGKQAVLPNLNDKISIFKTKFPSEYENVANSLLDNRNSVPAFISSSMNWLESQDIYKAFESLSPPAVIVTASGNGFHNPLDEMQHNASKNFNAILVGSFSPDGFVSEFSQSGEELHILAPSDTYIISADATGRDVKFGGTSGASPLVTASLAGFEWLSDYHPTAEEAKWLLEKTAIPTLHIHEEPRQNGVGLLNAYKLGMVGKRLKEKCQNKSVSCFQEEIKNKENYQFIRDNKKLKSDIAHAFPNCSVGTATDKVSKESSCEDKKNVFKELRQTALLMPDRRELWETLSCIYTTEGFSQNGEALSKIALSIDSREGVLHELHIIVVNEKLTNKQSAILLIRNIEKQGSLEFFQHLSENPNPIIKRALAIASGGMGRDGLQFLYELSNDDDKYVRDGVVMGAERMGGAAGLELLRKLSEDPSEEVRISVVNAAENLRGAGGLELLRKLSGDPSEEVRISVVNAAEEIGGEVGLEHLRKLSEDPSEKVRISVVNAAESFKGKGGLELLRKLSEDSSKEVKIKVAGVAEKIGGEVGLELLRKLSKDNMKVVRGMAAVHAARMGGEGALKIIRQLSQDDVEFVRSMVAMTTGYMDKEVSVEILVDLLQDSSEDVKKEAFKAIERLGIKNEFEFLTLALKHPGANVRRKAAVIAGNMGGEQGGQILRILSKDTHKFVREKVVDAAAEMNGEQGGQILQILAQDTNTDVRYRARRALVKLNSSK